MLYKYNMIEDDADDKVFKAMAAPLRRALMDALREEPQTTGALCARFAGVNRCTLMQHLGVLEDAGIVVVRRQGRLRWNHLDVLPVKRVHDRWIGDYAAHAVDLLNRLKQDLDATETAG